MTTPEQPVDPAVDHAIVRVSRRAIVARARFERELAALIDDLHTVRETIHGHALPREHGDPADQPEDTP
jgi:hypothetical protein